MIELVKFRKSLTMLSTLTPVSVNTSRNLWIEQMNGLIKALGQEQGVAVVDAYAAFRSAPNLKSLYFDDIHLNDAGYQVLAQTYAKALTTGRNASATAYSSDDTAFGFTEPSELLPVP
jgi:lysophospholipase L1-like esterase